MLDEEIRTIQSIVGPDEHVICALSGGIDSMVAATLLDKAIGSLCFCLQLSIKTSSKAKAGRATFWVELWLQAVGQSLPASINIHGQKKRQTIARDDAGRVQRSKM